MEKVINPEWFTSGCTWPTKKEMYLRAIREREEAIEQQALLETRKRQSLQVFAALKQQYERTAVEAVKERNRLETRPKSKLVPVGQRASQDQLEQLAQRFKDK